MEYNVSDLAYVYLDPLFIKTKMDENPNDVTSMIANVFMYMSLCILKLQELDIVKINIVNNEFIKIINKSKFIKNDDETLCRIDNEYSFKGLLVASTFKHNDKTWINSCFKENEYNEIYQELMKEGLIAEY